jgi:hypothetical protein
VTEPIHPDIAGPIYVPIPGARPLAQHHLPIQLRVLRWLLELLTKRAEVLAYRHREHIDLWDWCTQHGVHHIDTANGCCCGYVHEPPQREVWP